MVDAEYTASRVVAKIASQTSIVQSCRPAATITNSTAPATPIRRPTPCVTLFAISSPRVEARPFTCCAPSAARSWELEPDAELEREIVALARIKDRVIAELEVRSMAGNRETK